MDKDVYIKLLEEENAELKKHIEKLEGRIEELERLLGINSRNSSRPPSSDPPARSAVLPRHRRKKRGAKNGHQPHLRQLLPPEMVKQRFDLKPHICTCGSAAVFMVHAERGQKAARKLLGAFCGTLNSDRWGGYNFFCGIRQICWAHLKRDFKAISEAKDAIGKIGQELYGLAKKILKLRKRVRMPERECIGL